MTRHGSSSPSVITRIIGSVCPTMAIIPDEIARPNTPAARTRIMTNAVMGKERSVTLEKSTVPITNTTRLPIRLIKRLNLLTEYAAFSSDATEMMTIIMLRYLVGCGEPCKVTEPGRSVASWFNATETDCWVPEASSSGRKLVVTDSPPRTASSHGGLEM
jgi:hypothetical protein